MALIFDANSVAVATITSPITWSHTCGGGIYSVLIVGMGHSGTGNPTSAITYGGRSMTKIGSNFDDGTALINMWILVNPPSGANTVSATFGPGITAVGAAVSFTGFEDVNITNTGSASGTAVSTSVTPTKDETFLVDLVLARGTGAPTLTVGGSQTQRQNVVLTASMQVAMSTRGIISPPASTSMTWTISVATSPSWLQMVVCLSNKLPRGFTINNMRPAIFTPGQAR